MHQSPTGCFAPMMQLHFKPTGDVLACCWSLLPLGNVRELTLREIWDGAVRHELIDRLRRDDLGHGCEGCANEIAREGRSGSHPEYFDWWEQQLLATGAHRRLDAGPSRIEFELSNACNLQCQHCSGEYSSAIRLHRERRPPLPTVYGDAFFDELADFLPGLVDVSFAGGEPFLGAENFRVWELLAELNPSAKVTITTNATQWTPRVEQVLDHLDPDIVVSLDGASAATYESIRLGASFDAVLRNLDHFIARAHRARSTIQINFCWMPQNHAELVDVLLLAEARGVVVNVIVVRSPVAHSIPLLESAELDVVARSLNARAPDLLSRLELNRHGLVRALESLEVWRDAARSPIAVATERPTILMFRRSGIGPTDPNSIEVALRRDGNTVWRLEVDSLDRVAQCPASLATILGAEVDGLIGQSTSTLVDHLRSWDIKGSEENRSDLEITFRDGSTGVVAIVPERDATGRADSAVMLFARPAGNLTET